MLQEKMERLRKLLEAPPPTTDEGKDELDQAYREYLQAEGEDIERCHLERRRALEAAAGEAAVAALAGGADAIDAGLASPDVAVRRLALFLAHDHHPDLLSADRLRVIIASDCDAELRSSALCHLGVRMEGTRDPAVGQFLAGLVSAQAEPERVRLDAYRALIYLRGSKGHWYPGLLQLRFPDDVDWALVARFLPGTDPGRSAS